MLAVPVTEVIDQTPPKVTLVNSGVVEFTHTEAAPLAIRASVGMALTVIDLLAEAVHPPLVTV